MWKIKFTIGLQTLIMHSCWSIMLLCCLFLFLSYLFMFKILFGKGFRKENKKRKRKPLGTGRWPQPSFSPSPGLAPFSLALARTHATHSAQAAHAHSLPSPLAWLADSRAPPLPSLPRGAHRGGALPFPIVQPVSNRTRLGRTRSHDTQDFLSNMCIEPL